MQIETVTVLGQESVRGDYRLIKFASRKIAPQVKPGQFVHLRVAGRNDLVLRRPFSVFKADRHSLFILYKIVGSGTAMLSGLRPGDRLSMIGPLGNGFPLPAAGSYPLFIAGGYGSAAVYLLAKMVKQKGALFIGGKTKEDILCVDDFKKIGWKVFVTTEDGSMGQNGLVTDILLKYMGIARLPNLSFRVKRGISAKTTNTAEILRKTQDDKRLLGKKHQIELFACGPMGMLKAVSEIAIRAGITAWLSLDRNMGCGVGACLGCVQKIKPRSSHGKQHGKRDLVAKGWEWARICTEGPVFECREIVWE